MDSENRKLLSKFEKKLDEADEHFDNGNVKGGRRANGQANRILMHVLTSIASRVNGDMDAKFKSIEKRLEEIAGGFEKKFRTELVKWILIACSIGFFVLLGLEFPTLLALVKGVI